MKLDYIDCCDCLEGMKQIPDGIVDMILCDLPYGTTDCGWDKMVPVRQLFEQYRRIIKGTGTICLFGSEPFAIKVRSEALDLYKYDWIWLKDRATGFQHAKNKPLKNFENIMVFSKGTSVHSSQSKRRMTYNPQGIVPCGKVVKAGATKFGSVVGSRPSHREEYVQEYTNYPRMVLSGFKLEGKRLHETQKPESLCEYLIRTYSNRGEIVLDNCVGSGTTAEACIRTGRHFIGFELDPKYYKIAVDRVEAARKEIEGI